MVAAIRVYQTGGPEVLKFEDVAVKEPGQGEIKIKQTANGLNFIDNISCHRLNMALRMVCQDDLGKEAVRDGLKLIRLKNVKDKAAMRLTFEAGVLEMHCAYAQRTDGMFSDGEIRELLTKKL